MIQALRYGENPHQHAAFYRTPDQRPGVATARQLQGKELSYNNINDTDAAYECLGEFDATRTAAVVIVKHANPCGVAEGADLVSAYRKALACDSTSAFGGIVALNRTLDADAARAITEIFTEVIIAPDATDEAIAIVATKKNLRLLLAGALPDPRTVGLTVKTVAGGLLVQSRDNAVVDGMTLKVATKRAPTEAEMRDLKFAFRVAKHVKSNTIVYAKDLATVGIGAGQMSRVELRADRRAQGAGCRRRIEAGRADDQGLGGRVRRVLSVRRRAAGRDRGRRHRGDPARRIDPRRRSHQGRRRCRHRHGVHRYKAFPALTGHGWLAADRTVANATHGPVPPTRCGLPQGVSTQIAKTTPCTVELPRLCNALASRPGTTRRRSVFSPQSDPRPSVRIIMDT